LTPYLKSWKTFVRLFISSDLTGVWLPLVLVSDFLGGSFEVGGVFGTFLMAFDFLKRPD
jgi:hypothetical protein